MQITNEDLRNWFREKWVNLAKKKKMAGMLRAVRQVRKKDMRNVYLLL